MRGLALGVISLVAVSAIDSPAQVTVSVNRGTRFQTIEGFGASGVGFGPWKERSGPFYVDVNLDTVPLYDSVISELGVTAFRIYTDGRIETTPGATDHPEAFSSTYYNLRKFAAAAERHNEPLRFITTSWSPPAWMKVNGTLECYTSPQPACQRDTCRLKAGRESDVADYLVRWVRLLEDSAGIDVYAVSHQNEPGFAVAYSSCVYCPLSYANVLKVVGRRFRDEGMGTLLYGAEDISWAFNRFEAAVRADAEALGYMHAWATHGYTDGVHADTGAYGGSTPTDKPLWMTETSGRAYGATMRDWSGALLLAKSILSYLREGRFSAWVWWTMMHTTTLALDEAAASALLVNGQPTDKYYVSSHYYRYIRPGARQIESSSSSTNVKVAAFYHEGNDCFTVVLLNTGAATTVSGIGGANVPATLEKITSTDGAKLQRSTVASNESIALPASSITTLVAGSYRGTGPLEVESVAPHVSPEPGFSAPLNAVRMEIMTLDGRRVDAVGAGLGRPAKRLPAGIYVRAYLDQHGRVVSSSRLTVEGR